MDKKILCFISNTNLFGFGMKGVNQQKTLSSRLSNINEKDKGFSETTCDITYNFDESSNLIPWRSQHIKINKKKFLEWFIGFTEGDGYFIVSKDKVYFDITQNLQDIQVLYYIKKELGFGKVIIISEHRNVGVFYVSSKDNLLD